MRTKMRYGIIKRTFQVFHHRPGFCGIVIKVYLFIQNRVISGFFQISSTSGDKPERVIVKAASDIHISFFREGLILMVGASILKLSGGNIQKTLPCTVRNQMYKAKEILTGIPESHAAASAGFVVGSGTRHIKGYHTLILIPDVDHTVQLFLSGGDGITSKQSVPVRSKGGKRLIYLFICLIVGEHFLCRFFVDDAGGLPFLFLRVFAVAKNKDERAGFARL